MRWRLVLAAVLLVIAQLAMLAHLTGHAAAGDNAGCAVCLAAGNLGSAVPASAAAPPAVAAPPSLVATPGAEQPSARIVVAFRARAPPFSV